MQWNQMVQQQMEQVTSRFSRSLAILIVFVSVAPIADEPNDVYYEFANHSTRSEDANSENARLKIVHLIFVQHFDCSLCFFLSLCCFCCWSLIIHFLQLI